MTEATIHYVRALEHEVTLLRRYTTTLSPDLDTAAARSASTKAALVRETHGDVTPMPPTALNLTHVTATDGRVETILIVTFHGGNRSPEILDWHRRVTAHLGVAVNYIQCPFPAVSHGACMNQLIAQTIDWPVPPDYYLFLDNDCVPLRREALSLAYQQVHDHLTVWGHAWQSNHKHGPNGSIPHAYASQACLLFPRDLYLALGRPDMDHWVPRSDTAEELTYGAKTAGYNVSLLYPSHSVLKDTPLDNGMGYGLGNTYGPLARPLWHHTSNAANARQVEVFVETCKLVLTDAFEGDKPALPYGFA